MNEASGPAISDLSYGYDKAGVEKYLEAIHSEYLLKAKEAVEDVSKIKQCCETEWAGKARENFVTNLESDAKHVGEQLDALYNLLVSEVNSLQAAMSNKDEELINVD